MDPAIQQAATWLREADGVLVAASNGFDVADGYRQFSCDETFRRVFGDFQRSYGLSSIIQGLAGRWPRWEERWAFLARLIAFGYRDYAPTSAMRALRRLTDGRPRFVVTCNCNGHFARAGFADDELFETEGSFARLRCSAECRDELFDALPFVKRIERQRDGRNPDAGMEEPSAGEAPNASRTAADVPFTTRERQSATDLLSVPSELVPRCPHCGAPLDVAVDDRGGLAKTARFRSQRQNAQAFLARMRDKRTVVLELGVGQRNQAIKRPLMEWSAAAPQARYVVVNHETAVLPTGAKGRALGVAADLDAVLSALADAADGRA